MAVKKRAPAKKIANDPVPFTGFKPTALTFLRGLAKNNRKEWFEAKRDVYEQELRAPLLALIEEVDVQLASIAPEIVGTKKSLFRIHRDVRFSKDKSPYKTNAAAWFFHRDAGRQVGENAAHGGAGFYFQLSPNDSFSAGGIWMPPRPVLNRIREAIAHDGDAFADIVQAPTFRRRFGKLHTDAMLTRMPRGFAPDHPAGDWLRYQSFTSGRPIATESLQSKKLVSELVKDFTAMLPLVRWLNGVSGLPSATQR